MHFLYAKIRAEREARKLTIKELSRICNVSPGMISSVERGLVNPSIDVLFRICNVLQVSVDFFLPQLNDSEKTTIFKKKEQYVSINPTSKTYFTSPLFEKLGHSVLLIYLNKNAEYGRRHIVPDSTELILVIKGSVIFYYMGKEHVLEQGDSAYFSAGSLHYVKNCTSEEVILVWCLFKQM